MMDLKFLGAAGMVTGSCYQLTSSPNSSILIDMGMFQGTAKEAAWNFQPLQFNPQNIAAVILTHAHLDHCGRLPLLSRQGFTGTIFMTPATYDLVELILMDSAKIAKSGHKDNNRPLYTEEDVDQILRQVKTIGYHEEFKVADFTATFYDAGHLLGSASVTIDKRDDTGNKQTVVFSGDLGNTPQLILRPTELLDQAETVIMESTYGDRAHPTDNPSDILAQEIAAIEQTEGTLLIPAFALERTQDILVLLGDLVKCNRVSPRVAFFLDSPLAIRATEVYLHYPDLFNADFKKRLTVDNVFDFSGLEIVQDYKLSQRIKKFSGPKVIIAGAGMMTGGRILAHAAEFLPLRTTRLLLVGYQGEETLGREILEGAKRVQIDKRFVPIHASINETQALSSHADQPRLLNWLGAISGVKQVFLTHGDDGPRQVLAQKIKTDLGIDLIHTPQMNEVTSLVD